MLTKSDLEQIKNYLALYGKKDSQLETVPVNLDYPEVTFEANDYLSVVQDSKNKTIKIKDLEKVFLLTFLTDEDFREALKGKIPEEMLENACVTTEKLADGAVTTIKLGDNAVTTAKIATGAITGDKIVNNTIQGSAFAANSITTDKIVDGTVTGDKLADGSIQSVDIKDNTLSGSKFIDNSISGSKIQDNVIESKHLLDNSIPASKIKDGSIESIDIKDGTLDGTKIKDNTIESVKLANNAVTADKIIDNSVTTSKIANDAVTEDKIVDDSITTNKIANSSVTTDKIVDGAITEDKLANGAVTTDKLADGLISEIQNITDATPTTGSVKPVQSGGVKTAIDNVAFSTNEKVKNVGIDNEPIAGSNNLVKSLGVQNELALGAVYDVSVKNPTSGPNSDGKWESLSALLSDTNLNTLIPTSVRKGGMSVKFVQSSDNKYVQFRYMSSSTSTSSFTNIGNWQGVDKEPSPDSHNIIESGGVFLQTDILNALCENTKTTVADNNWVEGYFINIYGEKTAFGNYKISNPVAINKGDIAYIMTIGASTVSLISSCNQQGTTFTPRKIGTGTNLKQSAYYVASSDGYITFSAYNVSPINTYAAIIRKEDAQRFLTIEQALTDRVSYSAQTKTDIEKAQARNNIGAASNDYYPVYGKQNPVIGLTGATEQILTILNKVVKSFSIRNIASGFDKENVRFAQLYYNVQYAFWQIELGYNNGGSALTNIESFTMTNHAVDTYQTTSFKMVIDWSELNSIQPSSTSAIFQNYQSSNPYKVHFSDDDVYINGSALADESVGEDKLSSEVQQKINSGSSILNGKRLVTLCDSLGAAGIWQTKLAELTGMVFDITANNTKYSIGGTKTLSFGYECGQGRALQLINDVANNITDTPDIIIIENVNDGAVNPGTLTDESFVLSQIIALSESYKQETKTAAEEYWNTNMATILGEITPKSGTIVKIPYSTDIGIKLTITHAATSSGNLNIYLTDSELKTIDIADGDSIETIVDKIMTYNFLNYTLEKVGTDSVVFTKNYSPMGTITVSSTATGITYTTTSGIEGTLYYPRLFKGHNTANWLVADNWGSVSSISLYQAWKGMIEMLTAAFPNAIIYWFIPKTYQFNYNDSQYTRADGSKDWDAMLVSANQYGAYLFGNQKKMAEYMNIPVLDIRQDACINPGNISTFCNNNNVHPKDSGYNRWGEVLARMLF